jgi:CBS domain-containing protein
MSSDEDAAQQETLIGWADVQDILHDFIVPNTPRLAQLTQWDAGIEAVAASYCQRRLLVVTGEDGGLLPQVNADISLHEAVTSGFLSVGGAGEHTLTPRSRGAEADEGDAYERGVAPAPGRAVHRLALFAGGKIRSIVSQSDVMRYLYATSERLGPLARESVESLGFVAAAKKVLCVTPQTPAFAAFNVMYANALSAVGIVDPETEALVGTLSASDVRRLQAHTFNTLVLPVTDFLSAQAPAAQSGLRPPLAVSPAAPFLRVLELLGGSPRIHRVYVTDARGRPVGVVRPLRARTCRSLRRALTPRSQITPTDVLRFLVARES